MKNTAKKILTPEEIATVKAAAKILRKLQKKVSRMTSSKDYTKSYIEKICETESWLEELYKEAKIDMCDEMLFIDVAG